LIVGYLMMQTVWRDLVGATRTVGLSPALLGDDRDDAVHVTRSLNGVGAGLLLALRRDQGAPGQVPGGAGPLMYGSGGAVIAWYFFHGTGLA
jgi:hypothetical protein